MWRNLFRNTFWLGLADLSAKGLGFLLAIALARVLDAQHFGQYTWAMAFAALLQFLLDYGFHTLTVRDLSTDHGRAGTYYGTILVIKGIFFLVALVLAAAAFLVIPNPASPWIAVILAVAYSGLLGLAEYARTVFRIADRFALEAYTKLLQGLIVIGLALTTAYFTHSATATLAALVVAMAVAATLTGAIAHQALPVTLRFDRLLARYVVREAFPFSLTIVFTSIYFRIDSLILGAYVDAHAVGIYSAAYQPIMILGALSHILMGALFPTVNRWVRDAEFERHRRSISLVVLGIAAILATAVFLFREFVVTLLFGQQYRAAVQPLAWLSLAGFFEFLVYWNFIVLSAHGKQRVLVPIEAVTALTNLALNFLWIPREGLVGAAKATAVSYALMWLMYFAAVRLLIRAKPKSGDAVTVADVSSGLAK